MKNMEMRKKGFLSLVFLLIMAMFAPGAAYFDPCDEYVPNEIIVKFHEPVAETIEDQLKAKAPVSELKLSRDLDRLNTRHQAKEINPLFKNFTVEHQQRKGLQRKDKSLLTEKEKHILRRLKRAPKGARVPDLSRIYKLEFELEEGQSLEELVAAYNEDQHVEYAELNYYVYAHRTPNDLKYYKQWGLEKIDAPEAWDISTGRSDIIVAVIDSGVTYTHGDLDDNMWVNSGEIPDNGVDDDGNGYIDDVYGYDFINGDSNPRDDNGHGTHCAGIVAAEGDNGLDIAGVCWDARIMALKFLDRDGRGATADAVRAFYYAIENGADITSNSWGGGSYLRTLEEVIAYAHSQGVITVAAAGNDGCDCPEYPSFYEHVIAVAATDSSDQKPNWSNYGNWVDIAAPGDDILSLFRFGGTTSKSGTSMACPHVAGACALLQSVNPLITPDEVYDILMETVDVIFTPGICHSNGRLNLFNALNTIYSSQGHITLDHDYYSCSSDVSVLVADSNLVGQSSQEITLTTSGGDSEMLILLKTTSSLGVFEGTISTASGGVNTEDGILQISHGEVITATYEDLDDGTGSPATATDTAEADCQGPVIFNIEVDAIGPEPTVTFETDEPTTARLLCGPVCEGPYIITEQFGLAPATSYSAKLLGLSPGTDYYFMIEATDTVGNETVEDNAGNCHTFVTDEASDIYVPDDYPNIQEAIDRSWDGGRVFIADGTYTGTGNRDIDFRGRAIIVRSENGPENCIIDCNGTSEEYHRGFYFHSGEVSESILDGFTITNGYHEGGGAIYCRDSSPRITSCNISHNTSDWWDGGGIFCKDSNPEILNCTISDNSTEHGYGGGICCWNSSPKISNCTISGNTSRHSGGGIDGCGGPITNCMITGNSIEWGTGAGLHNCSGPISNCAISDNTAAWEGGGLSNCNGPISNCTITGNTAGVGGGLYYCEGPITSCIITDNEALGHGGGGLWGCHGHITNCTITGNSAAMEAGGLSWCNGYITNCNISGNWARFGGGLGYCEGTIRNCTIADNAAIHRGGGLTHYTGTIINCIIWGNVANSGAQLYASADPTFSCIENWSGGGEHNISDDPCFIKLGSGYWDDNNTPDTRDDFWVGTEGDYHLLEGSPCIDAGDPNFVPEPNETDLDGNPRVVDGDNDGNSVVDMGAYERMPGPADLIAWLLEEVGGLELSRGIENSLMAKLNSALAALEDENENNDAAAVYILEAFINAVEAQRGKKIPQAEADDLIAAAQQIIDLLSDS